RAELTVDREVALGRAVEDLHALLADRPEPQGATARDTVDHEERPRIVGPHVTDGARGKDQRARAARDLDVDRDRHVHAELGRRARDEQADLDRPALRVDARTDAPDPGLEAALGE